MAKRIVWLIIVIVIIFGGLFGTRYYQDNLKKKSKKSMPTMVIAASTVISERWELTIPTIGSLVADSGIYVANEVPGTVSTLNFKSGQKVNKGQLLIELDRSIEDAELASLKATAALARLRVSRQEKLLKKKSTSKERYDESKTLLDKAKAEIQAKIATINKKKIRASFSGELGIRLVNKGEFLPVGTKIVSLQTLDPIHVDFSIPERYLSSVYKQQPLVIQVQAYPDKRFTGEVTAFNPDVEKSSRSIKVRATFQNSEGLLRPGMFADVNLLIDADKQLNTLPDTAISFNPYGNYVFLIEESEGGLTVNRKSVVVGSTFNGRVEIVDGIELGDRVVSAGHVKLRNGMTVAIDDKPAPSERAKNISTSAPGNDVKSDYPAEK